MKTCPMRSKHHNQYLSDNREPKNKQNPLYTFFTMNNIFHDRRRDGLQSWPIRGSLKISKGHKIPVHEVFQYSLYHMPVS